MTTLGVAGFLLVFRISEFGVLFGVFFPNSDVRKNAKYLGFLGVSRAQFAVFSGSPLGFEILQSIDNN